jgi:Pyridine nucleotide-disulphide oxidoreductase
MDSSSAKKSTVILGGGFAGVESARYLDRTAAKCDDVEVTLVSRENFTVFTPMLHEVAAGDLEPNHICNPLRKLLGRVVVLTGNARTVRSSATTATAYPPIPLFRIAKGPGRRRFRDGGSRSSGNLGGGRLRRNHRSRHEAAGRPVAAPRPADFEASAEVSP